MTYGSKTSGFDQVVLPVLAGSNAWQLQNTATAIIASVYDQSVPASLYWFTNPGASTAGANVTGPPQVMLLDAIGTQIATATDQVTLTVLDSVGVSTGQTVQANAVNGVATFPALVINTAGTHSLRATSGTLPPITSAPFVVGPTAASAIVKVSGDAQNGAVGQALAQPVHVRVDDTFGNPVSGVSVSFVVTGGGGSATPPSVNTDLSGEASASWQLGGALGGQSMEARVTGLTSQAFTATAAAGAASKLAFGVQPSNVNSGASITPAVTVKVQDSFGHDVSSTASIGLALGANPGGAVLSGGTPVAAVNGVATFSGLQLDKGGVGYTLAASSTGLTGATSSAFAVTAPATIQLDMGGNAVVGVGASAQVNVTLTTPAPAGGLVVTLTSDTPGAVSVLAPGTVFIAQGTTTGQVTINGVALGSSLLHASASGYIDGTLLVQATNQIISTPATLTVPYGLSVSFPIQLAIAAPAGGLAVTVTTSDASHVDVVTQTVTVPAGQLSANGTLSGSAPGAATITASAQGWVTHSTVATTTADLVITATTINLDPVFTNTATVEFRSGGIARAAPAGGIDVTITPANPACAVAQSPVHINAGQVSVNSVLSYGGSAVLPCNTLLTASSPNLNSGTATAHVNTPPVVTLAGIGQIGSGLQGVGRSGSLSAAAPPGGLDVHLVSADSNVILLAPDATTPGHGTLDIHVTQGFSSFTYVAQALENVTGDVVVTATAPPYTGSQSTATVVTPRIVLSNLSTNFTSLTASQAFWATVGTGTISGLSAAQGVRAGAPPVVVTFTSSNPAVGAVVTATDSGATATATLVTNASNTPTSRATGGVVFDPQTAGSTTVAVSAPGFLTTNVASVNVNVTTPTVTVAGSGSLGSGLQLTRSVSLSAPAPAGGEDIRLVSTDSSKLLLAPNATTAGTGSLTMHINAGFSSTTFSAQAVELQTGDVPIQVSANDFIGGSSNTNIVTPWYVLSNVPANRTSLDAPSAFWVTIGTGSVGGLSAAQSVRWGGDTLVVTVTSSNASAAQLVTTALTGPSVTVKIGQGQSNSPTSVATGGVALDPVGAGSTAIAASIPNLNAANTATVNVNVTAPAVTVAGLGNIGSGLQAGRSFSLGAPAPDTGRTVHLVSSDSTLLLLAPNATSVGHGTLDIKVAAGFSSGTFVAQGLESVTGSVTVTGTAQDYTSGSGSGNVQTPIVVISNLSSTFSTLTGTSGFWVTIGVGSVSGLSAAQGVRFGAPPVIATLTNSAQSVAQLVTSTTTGQVATVTINPNQSNSPTSVATGGVGFDPLAQGSTTVAVTIPGFIQANLGSQTVSVTAPVINMPGTFNVGSGLQATTAASLSATSSTQGVTVHLVSSDSTQLLLAPNATSVGHGTLDVVLGPNNASIPFTVQGLENLTGTVTVTASANGYVDGSSSVHVVQPVFVLSNLSSTFTVSGPQQAFWVTTGVGSFSGLSAAQSVRFGGVPLTVTITNSDATVAELVTTPLTGQSVTVGINPGQSNSPTSVATGGVAFHAKATGSTTVTSTIPGFAATSTSTRVVTVNP